VKLLALAAAGWVAAAAVAPDTKVLFDEAYREVKSSVMNANILLAAAQARCKTLQFAYNELSQPKRRDAARKEFDELTERLGAFRREADAADSGTPRTLTA
jgi:hypothetical protein